MHGERIQLLNNASFDHLLDTKDLHPSFQDTLPTFWMLPTVHTSKCSMQPKTWTSPYPSPSAVVTTQRSPSCHQAQRDSVGDDAALLLQHAPHGPQELQRAGYISVGDGSVAPAAHICCGHFQGPAGGGRQAYNLMCVVTQQVGILLLSLHFLQLLTLDRGGALFKEFYYLWPHLLHEATRVYSPSRGKGHDRSRSTSRV